jgi:transposase-like protein
MQGVFASGYVCPQCGREATIKDNERFSSLVCGCKCLLYYYDEGRSLEISRDEFLEYKRKKAVQGGSR